MPVTTPFGDIETKPAPGALARVQALINTLDRESGADVLADPASARQWLMANGLLAPDTVVSSAEIEAVTSVREALRALVVHTAGGPEPDAATLQRLRDVTAQTVARVVLDADGTVRLKPTADTVAGRLLDLLLAVRDAQSDGTWGHLKACANPECQWAFYDRSRNHGGSWCDMATCGNKLKNRDFRARRRADGSG
jgi:predicted RNA-binding Zn ribbon-like protein